MKLFILLILLLAVSSSYSRGLDRCYKKDPNFSYSKSGDIIIKGNPTNDDTITIAVAATSDMHGRIYPWDYTNNESDDDAGFALTDTVVNKIKSEYPNTLLIDVGDLMQDNKAELFLNHYTHPMVRALNFLKYDVWIPGNHEFNYGLDFLEKNVRHFCGRVVCSNIEYADSHEYYLFFPYQIFIVAGVRVAVVGVTAPHIKQWEAGNPDHFKNLEFTDPIESLKKTIKSIEGRYDILIGAAHISRNGEYEAQGKSGVFQIAEAIPEFDAIFAGHEHATYCKSINNIWVLEPGGFGSHVSFAKFEMKKENDKWKIVTLEAKNISTKGVEASDRVIKKFKWVHDQSLANTN